MIIHSGIVFLSQAANVSDYMPRKRAATAICYGLSYTVIAQSGNLEVWHPESGIGVGGGTPGTKRSGNNDIHKCKIKRPNSVGRSWLLDTQWLIIYYSVCL